jgi:hypothetical protein
MDLKVRARYEKGVIQDNLEVALDKFGITNYFPVCKREEHFDHLRTGS